jgi:hypothetical protein
MLCLCDPVSLMHVNRASARAREFDWEHSGAAPL